jgi:hypothetical protein
LIEVHGFGPLYWGEEDEPTDPKVFSLAWLVELDPPFRKSFGRSGIRIRIKDRAFHIGLCRRTPSKDLVEQLGGRNLEHRPKQISLWGEKVRVCPYCGEEPDDYCPACWGTGYEIVDGELE